MDHQAEQTIYPSFGSLGYWTYIKEAPEGTVEERAEALLVLMEKCSDLPAERWSIKPIVARAMTLELAAAMARQSGQLSPAMLKLLAAQLRLPEHFLRDPAGIYRGKDGKGQPADSATKNAVEWIDALHFRKHRKRLSITALRKEVQKQLSLNKAPSHSSVRAWRAEPDYVDFMKLLAEIE